jgi:hypothetical protein
MKKRVLRKRQHSKVDVSSSFSNLTTSTVNDELRTDEKWVTKFQRP